MSETLKPRFDSGQIHAEYRSTVNTEEYGTSAGRPQGIVCYTDSKLRW